MLFFEAEFIAALYRVDVLQCAVPCQLFPCHVHCDWSWYGSH